jgi:hypothetical protein
MKTYLARFPRIILAALLLFAVPALVVPSGPVAAAEQPAVNGLFAEMVVTVSGKGATRVEAEAAARRAARQTNPNFRVKKMTFERDGAGWVCTMEIIVP